MLGFFGSLMIAVESNRKWRLKEITAPKSAFHGLYVSSLYDVSDCLTVRSAQYSRETCVFEAARVNNSCENASATRGICRVEIVSEVN